MPGWRPTKIAHEQQDRKEIQALMQRFDEAGTKGDIELALSQLDFPVLMVTDDAKGQAVADAWTREQWKERMAPAFSRPMKDAKITHKYTVFLLSDALANVTDEWSMTAAGKKRSARAASIVVRRDGKWLVKSMMEPGWGDAPVASGKPDDKSSGAAAKDEPPQGAGATAR